jgi:hypothetical protein
MFLLSIPPEILQRIVTPDIDTSRHLSVACRKFRDAYNERLRAIFDGAVERLLHGRNASWEIVRNPSWFRMQHFTPDARFVQLVLTLNKSAMSIKFQERSVLPISNGKQVRFRALTFYFVNETSGIVQEEQHHQDHYNASIGEHVVNCSIELLNAHDQ